MKRKEKAPPSLILNSPRAVGHCSYCGFFLIETDVRCISCKEKVK